MSRLQEQKMVQIVGGIVIEEPEWASAREIWYNQTYILLEIVKQLSQKETAFLEKLPSGFDRKPKVIRCINAWSVDLLKANFEAFRFLQFPYFNIYFSLMDYKNMPMFSFSPPVRREQYDGWTAGGYKSHYGGFDWGIDLDSKSIPEAIPDALQLKKLFDQYQVPYSIKISGQKGLHLLVRSQWLPPLPMDKTVKMLAELTHRIKVIDKINSLDDSIIDERRIFKAAYTLDRGNVCLPLTDEQLENFDMKFASPKWVMENIQIKNRGMLERHTEQSVHQANKHFIELAENFIDFGEWFE
jgi:hypothetical protein